MVSDPDHTKEQLSWSVSGNRHIRAAISNGQCQLSAEPNWNGSENLTFTVSDPGHLTDSRTVNVAVNSVNDPPVLEDIPVVVMSEDESTTLDMSGHVSDPDHQPSQIRWTVAGGTNITARLVRSATISFSPTANWSGTEQVSVTATDPGGLSATRSVQVRVAPVNDPPTVRVPAAVEFNEDGTYQLNMGELASDQGQHE